MRLSSAVPAEEAVRTDHRILRTTTILSALAGLVLVATTARELIIANYFGRGDALDAYLMAYIPCPSW